MKKKMIFSIAFMVLFLASFFSCSTQEDKHIEIEQLLGHWHLIDAENTNDQYQQLKEYSTIYGFAHSYSI